MKRVSDGNNPHVLKMLGCVTTTLPMMLLLQFVPHGSLKDYLKAMKTVRSRYVLMWQIFVLNLENSTHSAFMSANSARYRAFMSDITSKRQIRTALTSTYSVAFIEEFVELA